MNSNFPRGSEWRKWDLHVHTPKSIIQGYGGDTPDAWNEFINTLAALPPEIKVIGITDYLFCDGYEYLLSRRAEIPNIELIIPNIEFRLNTFSGTANSTRRHNFHVLFDPEVSVQVIREQFLNGLASGYKLRDKSKWQQTPTPLSLAELGQQMKASAPAGNSVHTKSDLEVGFDNITYDKKDILKLLERSPFAGKFLIAIGYSEWDQSRWDQSAAEKRDLIHSANFCFSCQDDPAKIADHLDDMTKNNLASFILHSSDAHSSDRIGQSLLWVKADPSFAGLKQVINEPDSRVLIGATPPNYKHDHQIISKISIPASNGWFEDDFELELNRDLIAIIGGRGSGKSALAEAIAYGAGSKDSGEDAFLSKAAKYKDTINGAKITITWSDGVKTEMTAGDLTADQGLVRYLPQGAVEELCSHKNSAELRKQIEHVIFQSLEETEKMGASDFEELGFRVVSELKYEKEQMIKNIREINHKLGHLMTMIRGLSDKEKALGVKKKEHKNLVKSLPELPPEDKKGQEALAVLLKIKSELEAKIIALQDMLSNVIEIQMKTKLFKTQIQQFGEEIRAMLSNLGLLESKVFDIKLDEAGINAVLSKKKTEIDEKIKLLRDGRKKQVAQLMAVKESQLPFANLTSLNSAIEVKQRETKAFETVKLKYQQQQQAVTALAISIRALEDEIQKIKKESRPERERLEKERMRSFCAYFELLKNGKSRIEELYKPLQKSLMAGTTTDKKLIFVAQINHLFEAHVRSGLGIIDRTRKGNFREQGSLEGTLSRFWDEISKTDFDTSSIETNINEILGEFTVYGGKEILIEDQLRETCTLEDFYNWLFDPTRFEVVSSLTFDGSDLYVLSPGKKGIILLMLYLEIDKADYRPLLIDQPEENLDNLSVYEDVMRYFRDRKQYRQIIMVTHNPNLVVNTDAEQIVIADYDGNRTPRLRYSAGSLEDQAKKIPNVEVEDFEDGIIEQVCNILEGGEPAFQKRKKKYQISNRSTI